MPVLTTFDAPAARAAALRAHARRIADAEACALTLGSVAPRPLRPGSVIAPPVDVRVTRRYGADVRTAPPEYRDGRLTSWDAREVTRGVRGTGDYVAVTEFSWLRQTVTVRTLVRSRKVKRSGEAARVAARIERTRVKIEAARERPEDRAARERKLVGRADWLAQDA